MVAELHQQISAPGRNDIASKEIGEMVMTKLKEMDEIAYVRFASVYRKFKDKAEFLKQMQKLLE